MGIDGGSHATGASGRVAGAWRRLGLPWRWWVGVPVAGSAYWAVAIGAPRVARGLASSEDNILLPALNEAVAAIAPFLAVVVAFVVFRGWIRIVRQRKSAARRLDRQTGIDSVRSLSWGDFEGLLAEAYRRQGYRVELTRLFADGGVDLVLHRDGEVTVVQAKHWKTRKVGVDKVRELLGVQVARGADAAVLVTSGHATAEARRFGRENGIQILEAGDTVSLIRRSQSVRRIQPSLGRPAPADPVCPRCRSRMMRRVARRGPNRGSEFWGCSTFPRCRATIDIG